MQASVWNITDAPNCELNASFSLREVLDFVKEYKKFLASHYTHSG